MSGGSYSRSSYLGSMYGGEENTDCIKLSIETQVISPNMLYFVSVGLETILDVVLENEIVVLINESGDKVGAIHSPNIEKLIDCLLEGNDYEAKIINMDGAYITVLISSKIK